LLATHRQFWIGHLLLPLLVFSVLVIAIELTHFDLVLADWLFRLEGLHWRLKDHVITSGVLHEMGQHVSRLIGLALLLLAIGSHALPRLAPYRRGLWLLFLTLALGSLVVSVLKSLTHVDCPWDLQRYGGTRPYLSLYAAHPGNYAYGQCFPAGHASGGYGLLGLYFFLRHYRPDWKWYGLGLAIGVGLLFGIAQQLRGAHFLSHDLWALAICWLSALLLSRLLLPER
jgi:membrane-associated PAP2 superfamily phosphatase